MYKKKYKRLKRKYRELKYAIRGWITGDYFTMLISQKIYLKKEQYLPQLIREMKHTAGGMRLLAALNNRIDYDYADNSARVGETGEAHAQETNAATTDLPKVRGSHGKRQQKNLLGLHASEEAKNN